VQAHGYGCGRETGWGRGIHPIPGVKMPEMMYELKFKMMYVIYFQRITGFAASMLKLYLDNLFINLKM
jgi:hypothetical protein